MWGIDRVHTFPTNYWTPSDPLFLRGGWCETGCVSHGASVCIGGVLLAIARLHVWQSHLPQFCLFLQLCREVIPPFYSPARRTNMLRMGDMQGWQSNVHAPQTEHFSIAPI